MANTEEPQKQPSQCPVSEAEVLKYLKTAVEMAVGNDEYNHGMLQELHNNIVEYAMKKISAARPSSYKVVVTCTIVQNTGAGFRISNALHWDSDRDMMVTYKFQNKAMNIIVSAYLINS